MGSGDSTALLNAIIMKEHTMYLPNMINYSYREENLAYRIVFAESRNYKSGYNSGSLFVLCPLSLEEMKLFIANRLPANYPGVITLEEVEHDEAVYRGHISLQKFSWYVKHIVVREEGA